MGVLLPAQRLGDALRLVLWRRAQREDSLGKLGVDTPRYVVESDASIVAPLIFAYGLDA